MGFLKNRRYKRESESEEFETTTAFLSAIMNELTDYFGTWNSCDYMHVALTPGTKTGETTYRSQTGLVLHVCGDVFEDSLWVLAPDDLKMRFTDESEDAKYLYVPLSSLEIGRESRYVESLASEMKRTHPACEITIGSHGRQLSLVFRQ